MRLRGIYELRKLGKKEVTCVDGEYFAIVVQELDDKVKQQLHENTRKKKRSYLKRREVNFEVGDLVIEYLWKEKDPKEKIQQDENEKDWALQNSTLR